MNATDSGLFIVDNSDAHWKALDYLREWCDLSSAIDIATGYFEIGALLALDGAWQKVDKIRILIGGDTSRQTAEAIREARLQIDESTNRQREADPFLAGIEGIIEALRAGKIQVKVYKSKKFHAKTYITHARREVVGAAALVGSSNFTKPGLTQNVELNVKFSGAEVRDLQKWFEHYWGEAVDATPDVLDVLESQSRPYTPFEVFARALQVLTANVDPSAIEWEREKSRIYPLLSPYQREGYHGLKQRAGLRGGAFLTDGVGLGKTFVGMMLAEYYAVREKKNVLILATKTGKDAVWEPALRRFLPDLTGDFTRIRVMAHTDLSKDDALDQVAMLRERVDVVIVDEAHNFRNRGKLGDDPDKPRSRWRRLQMIAEGKLTFLLTATPINNTLFDVVHEFELWTGDAAGSQARGDDHFVSLGISSVTGHVTALERAFLEAAEHREGHEPEGETVTMTDFEQLLADSPLLEALIVQHSRRYAIESAKAAGATEVLFPEPAMPRAVPYDYNIAFSRLLDELERAANKAHPLFTLPMYSEDRFYRDPSKMNSTRANRQRQVVGLIRTIFLKRFESSLAAFAGSCFRLTGKIDGWLEVNTAGGSPERKKLEVWRSDHAAVLQRAHRYIHEAVDEEDDGQDDSDADLFDEYDDKKGPLDPQEFKVEDMVSAAFEDLQQLIGFLDRVVAIGDADDTKFAQLLHLLNGTTRDRGAEAVVFDPIFRHQKVIVFTEFADTARYLERRLIEAGVAAVDRLDGSRKGDRLPMIQRFAPIYNGLDDGEVSQLEPLRVLVSTDVLAEGVNLQDASLVVNYDVHWNPVRLMQRIGRVDRRRDASLETRLLHRDAALTKQRPYVHIRNFLPPEEINRLIELYRRLQRKALLISKTLGIPGGRLLDEKDIHDDTKVFAAFEKEYYGELSPIERLRLEFLEMVKEDPGLGARLDVMPKGVHSAKRAAANAGTFLCSIEPVQVRGAEGEILGWTLEEGVPRWALLFSDGRTLTFDGLQQIADAIRCSPEVAAASIPDKLKTKARLEALRDARLKDLRKELQLPLDAPTPTTICWMELV